MRVPCPPRPLKPRPTLWLHSKFLAIGQTETEYCSQSLVCQIPRIGTGLSGFAPQKSPSVRQAPGHRRISAAATRGRHRVTEPAFRQIREAREIELR